MQRLPIEARGDWNDQLVADGVLWGTTECGAYWSESMKQPVYYKLTAGEQFNLEIAANEVHSACLNDLVWLFEEADEATRDVWFGRFGIHDQEVRRYIMESWDKDEWGMYGRFDFVLTKEGPKLLEYNADTPTTLIETAVTQWNWFDQNREKLGKVGQFNELHEALIRHWADMKHYNDLKGKVHFAAFSQVDDMATAVYMAEAAREGGIDVDILPMEDIGWNNVEFTDPNETPIQNCFKLYPWEWMMEDEFGQHVTNSDTRWIEPAWKMMLANKAILALLWERHPDMEWLVPCYIQDAEGDAEFETKPGEKWVTKPLLSREGCNVKIWEIAQDGTAVLVEGVEGDYDESECVFQKYIEWDPIDGVYPMMGVWMVGDDAVALGIREDDGPITQNNSRFIPHVFELN